MTPLCILGPTASGKSAVALAVADANPDVELVSIDSMQVYRGMDVGTAKPTAEERARVRHHLIDLADPWDEFTVSLFQAEWLAVQADIVDRGKTPVLVGGTGLHLRAVIDALEIPGRYPEERTELEAAAVHDLPGLFRRLEELDPTAAARIDPGNDRRIVRALEVTLGSGRPFSSFGPGLEEYPSIPFRLLGLRLDRAAMDERINRRYDVQMADGFLEETRALLDDPRGIGRTARQALGYRELLRHLEEGERLDEMLEEARVRTRRFARRQLKWFGRDPRIEWIELDATGTVRHDRAIERAITLATAG
jgi:tRNA dimethylallyltransferase